MIAWFAETFGEAPGQSNDPGHEELAALVKARRSLIDFRTRLTVQSEHDAPALVQKARGRLLKKLAGEITMIEAAVRARIKSTPSFAERAEIIQSVPGCMRKLIIILNTMIARRQKWDPGRYVVS